MSQDDTRTHARWARFRFSVVGSLLAAPPPRGGLCSAVEALASRTWSHPITGMPTRFGFSTIERWYLVARKTDADPVGALRRKVRRDAGSHPSIGAGLEKAIHEQHAAHHGWSYKLHYDNLGAQVRLASLSGPLPSYSTIRRFMRSKGLRRAKGRRTPRTAGAEAATQRFEAREVRSYESTHAGALFHADFHECSRALLAPDGELRRPQLYGCLDDRSRLACHLQWYWHECARRHGPWPENNAWRRTGRGSAPCVRDDAGGRAAGVEVAGVAGRTVRHPRCGPRPDPPGKRTRAPAGETGQGGPGAMPRTNSRDECSS